MTYHWKYYACLLVALLACTFVIFTRRPYPALLTTLVADPFNLFICYMCLFALGQFDIVLGCLALVGLFILQVKVTLVLQKSVR